MALWGRLLAPSCDADLYFSLLLGTSAITACYVDLKPGVHQHSDCWLLLATFVLTACYADLKPGVHQNTESRLLLATFLIGAYDWDLKWGVRFLAAGGNFRPQDLKIAGTQGRRHRTPALKSRGGMGATLWISRAIMP